MCQERLCPALEWAFIGAVFQSATNDESVGFNRLNELLGRKALTESGQFNMDSCRSIRRTILWSWKFESQRSQGRTCLARSSRHHRGRIPLVVGGGFFCEFT